jgi:hypothetical protein
MTDPINTKSVQIRRLRFNSIAEVQAEADRIAAAEKSGKLKQLGNWSSGQIFNHLASWASFPYDGYPKELRKPPLFIRIMLSFKKKAFLHDKMPQGVRIPGLQHGTVATEVVAIDEAHAKLKAALKRLDERAPETPNPVFGPLPHDDWKRINMRHAELHMGFLQPL